jgi:hypothetical protein
MRYISKVTAEKRDSIYFMFGDFYSHKYCFQIGFGANIITCVGFKGYTAVTMKNAVFWM